MTRDDLIQLASQWQFSRSSNRDLAARMTSPEAVAREVELQTALADKYGRQSSVAWDIFVAGVASALVGLALGVCGGPIPMPAAAAAVAVAAVLALILFSMYVAAVASDNASAAKSTLAALTPVIGSSKCKTALKYVTEGRPAVLAWRDLAIAERNVLCAFDVQMLHELHYATTVAEEAAALQRENEQACRLLYGIAYQDALSAELSGTAA